MNSVENSLRLEQDETQIFADMLFYSKVDSSNSFWNAIRTSGGLRKWESELKKRRFDAGFGQFPDASGTREPSISYSVTSRVGEKYRVEDFITTKCPIESTDECIMITNCRGEDCTIFEGTAGFYAILERDGSRIQFTALQGNYELIK